jgi:hypothetical protein
LLPGDVEHLVEELTNYLNLFKAAFHRPEQAKWAEVYLNGLLGSLARKTTERIALDLGHNVRDLQHFIGQSQWSIELLLDIHQQIVAQTLGEEDGVALIDESGVVKQGKHSVGVGPQYCGSVGKVANSQNGVYLGYVSRKGYSVISGRLFMLEQWFDDDHAEKRQACGVPEDLTSKTKPQIGLDLLQETLDRGGLPFRWVAADELYGDSPAFRDGVAAMGKWYFTEIACSTLICVNLHLLMYHFFSARMYHVFSATMYHRFSADCTTFCGRNGRSKARNSCRTRWAGSGVAMAPRPALGFRNQQSGSHARVWEPESAIQLRSLSLWLTAPPVPVGGDPELESWRRG